MPSSSLVQAPSLPVPASRTQTGSPEWRNRQVQWSVLVSIQPTRAVPSGMAPRASSSEAGRLARAPYLALELPPRLERRSRRRSL